MPRILAATATLIALAAVALWAPWKTPPARSALRFTADFGARMSLLTVNGSPTLALSPDGTLLAFVGQPPGGEPQLYLRRLDQLNASPLERAEGGVASPFFSPNGQWIAYSSGESGRPEIYVQPFPSARGGKWKVSGESGGRYPAWSRASPMLMFMANNGAQLMSAPYTIDGNSFHPEKPAVWGEGRIGRLNGQRGFDLHPDGTRVVIGGVREPNAPAREDKAVFVFNFFDELRRLAPPARR